MSSIHHSSVRLEQQIYVVPYFAKTVLDRNNRDISDYLNFQVIGRLLPVSQLAKCLMLDATFGKFFPQEITGINTFTNSDFNFSPLRLLDKKWEDTKNLVVEDTNILKDIAFNAESTYADVVNTYGYMGTTNEIYKDFILDSIDVVVDTKDLDGIELFRSKTGAIFVVVNVRPTYTNLTRNKFLSKLIKELHKTAPIERLAGTNLFEQYLKSLSST